MSSSGMLDRANTLAARTGWNPCQAGAVAPRIRREGIAWTGGLGGAPLVLRLTFENPHPLPTAPIPATVRYAEYGAFLPWRPLTTVQVPPIPPGGRRIVTAAAFVPREEPPAGRTSPSGARAAGSWALRRDDVQTRLLRLLWGPGLPHPSGRPTRVAANIDVRVGASRPVERHLGTFKCLGAGLTNCAIFKVGSGGEHAHTIRITACPEKWEVEVKVPHGDLAADRADLEAGVTATLDYAVLLALITPPAEAREGRVALEFSRPQVGDATTVELELV